MFLVGVFLGPSGQPKTAPASPNASGANSVSSFSPLIGQQFFIGDGRTSAKALQSFTVPAGATRLYLGFAESWGFGHPNLFPGFYTDNGGSLSVDVERPVTLTINGVADAQRASQGGLVVMSSDNNAAPRTEITIQPSPFDLLLTEANREVSIYTSPTGGRPLTFNGTDNLFPKGGPAVHLYVQGDQHSNTMRDETLNLATKTPGQGRDEATFTVLWVSQPVVATSGTVSPDDSAYGTYYAAARNYNLGVIQKFAEGSSVMGLGTEARATVYPNDFSYPGMDVMLNRFVTYDHWYGPANNMILSAPVVNKLDTSLPVYRDDSPSSRGDIYDLDTPGPVLTTAPKGYIQRVRYNFTAFASVVINNQVVRISQYAYYFVDISIEQIQGPSGDNWVVLNDVPGDNRAGAGATKLSWNLK